MNEHNIEMASQRSTSGKDYECVIITRVAFDLDGRLRVYPSGGDDYSFIWREAMSVRWDSHDRSLYVLPIATFTSIDEFIQIMMAVYDGCGQRMIFNETTIFDVPEQVMAILRELEMQNDLGRQLEPQEIASLAALAYRFGLVDAADVVAWADSVIMNADLPPYWAIELALAKPDNLQELLWQIPGKRDEDLARRAFIALVRHHWRAGRLTISEMRVIGRKLYFLAPDSMTWGIVFDEEFEAFEEGYLSEDDLRTAVTEHLASFAGSESLLPGWMIRPGTSWSFKTIKAKLYQNAYDAVHDILTHEWDPIGIGNEPMAQDEYNAYIPHVLRMICDGSTDQEVAAYLEEIENEAIGLKPHKGIAERNLRVARRLREVVKPFLDR